MSPGPVMASVLTATPATRAATGYSATRIVHSSLHEFATTRARFDTQVPAFDPVVSAELVTGSAGWDQVVDAIEARAGPGGPVTVARVDQGALLSLSGEPLKAMLYLVGNPLVARPA